MSSRHAPAEKGLQISNPSKVLYPAGKFTKGDVVGYYERVARFLLPHFRNRPVTLKRYPNGVFGEAFYEKDATHFTPSWVKTFPVPRREGSPDINYIVINDVPTLTWAANMAALEMHPFLQHGNDIRLLSLKEKNLTSDFPTVSDAPRTFIFWRATPDRGTLLPSSGYE